MARATMTIDEALAYVREHAADLKAEECYALRWDNCVPKRKFRKSWHRDEDGRRITQLPGTSAVMLACNDYGNNYIERPDMFDLRTYALCEHLYLLCGKQLRHDDIDDAWEIVLGDHSIVAEIARPAE